MKYEMPEIEGLSDEEKSAHEEAVRKAKEWDTIP